MDLGDAAADGQAQAGTATAAAARAFDAVEALEQPLAVGRGNAGRGVLQIHLQPVADLARGEVHLAGGFGVPQAVLKQVVEQLAQARLIAAGQQRGVRQLQPQFQAGGKCILNTERLYYDGNSQGGIVGGALTAVAPDFTRATLGVLGMNYSTLLTRSTDFGRGNPPTSA